MRPQLAVKQEGTRVDKDGDNKSKVKWVEMVKVPSKWQKQLGQHQQWDKQEGEEEVETKGDPKANNMDGQEE